MRWIVIYCSLIWFAIGVTVMMFIAQLFLSMECGVPCPIKCPFPWNAQNFNHHALYNFTLAIMVLPLSMGTNGVIGYFEDMHGEGNKMILEIHAAIYMAQADDGKTMRVSQYEDLSPNAK